MDYRQRKAIESKHKKEIIKLYPYLDDTSGIYVLTRYADNIKYAYVGQSIHVLTRLAQHMMGYDQHIDRSLKKHKLYTADNPDGWKIEIVYTNVPVDQLDELEQKTILNYHKLGYQLLNGTLGGQGEGKKAIVSAPRKGYRDGVEYGYNKARKEIKHLFGKHLNVSTKKKSNKLQQKALEKFNNFIDI